MHLTNVIGRFRTVLIEGNIGSGKSTMISYFQGDPDVEVMPEPVDLWRDVGGVNILGKYYDDPETWAVTLQSYITLTMLENHLKPTSKPYKMLERSIYTARQCFVKSMCANGIIHLGSVNVLEKWYEFIDEQFRVEVDLIVYLRTTPSVAYERIIRRSREEEKRISLEYITELHQLHETWMNATNRVPNTPVYVIDADQPHCALLKEYERLATILRDKYVDTTDTTPIILDK